MAARDDFNSSMNSPGNYSKSSNYGGNNASNNLGGNRGSFGGTNNYGNSFQTQAQVRQVNAMRNAPMFGSLGGQGPWPGGYAGPVLQGPVRPPMARPQAYQPPPPVTQEDIPGLSFDPVAPDRNYPVPPRYVQPTRPMAPNVYGQPPQQMPQANQTIPYNPNGGGYTNIYKNNQGNLPGYPGGNQATYNRMGNDFRSIASW